MKTHSWVSSVGVDIAGNMTKTVTMLKSTIVRLFSCIFFSLVLDQNTFFFDIKKHDSETLRTKKWFFAQCKSFNDPNGIISLLCEDLYVFCRDCE